MELDRVATEIVGGSIRGAITLDKTSGHFSPTTRYRDYAISRDMVHWAHQSVTRAHSATGRRYQQHERNGSSVMLLARQRSDDRSFYFLGPATFAKAKGGGEAWS